MLIKKFFFRVSNGRGITILHTEAWEEVMEEEKQECQGIEKKEEHDCFRRR